MNPTFMVTMLFFVSITAFSQNLKLHPPSLFPSLLGVRSEFIRTISDAHLKNEKIQEEAQERERWISNLFDRKISYSERVRGRTGRIKSTLQKIAESRYYLQPIGTKISENLEDELLSLLDLSILLEEEKDNSSLMIDMQETNEPTSFSRNTQFSASQVPGLCLIPSSPSTSQSHETTSSQASSSDSGGQVASENRDKEELARRRKIIELAVAEQLRILAQKANRTVYTEPASGLNPLTQRSGRCRDAQVVSNIPALEWKFGHIDCEKVDLYTARAYATREVLDGWHLPTILELYALFQQKNLLPEDVKTSQFWSNTFVGDSSHVWVIDLSDAILTLGSSDQKQNFCLVRVRQTE